MRKSSSSATTLFLVLKMTCHLPFCRACQCQIDQRDYVCEGHLFLYERDQPHAPRRPRTQHFQKASFIHSISSCIKSIPQSPCPLLHRSATASVLPLRCGDHCPMPAALLAGLTCWLRRCSSVRPENPLLLSNPSYRGASFDALDTKAPVLREVIVQPALVDRQDGGSVAEGRLP